MLQSCPCLLQSFNQRRGKTAAGTQSGLLSAKTNISSKYGLAGIKHGLLKFSQQTFGILLSIIKKIATEMHFEIKFLNNVKLTVAT